MYIGVKFREQGYIYYFYTRDKELAQGDRVIVTTEEGQGIAQVALLDASLPAELPPEEVLEVDRRATDDDLRQHSENEEFKKGAFAYCRQRIKEMGLNMKLVDVEIRFDQSKLVFYFTAPARVDFRELVKDLVNTYRARIELRQIGVRHEAQILGGIGTCGRICCCHQFLRQFAPVTIRMAKEQQLFLNPSKISGVCGRLLCCLNFEKQAYADFYNRCPKIGKKYQTNMGELKVLRANFFRDTLVVDVGEGEEREINLLDWADLFSQEEEDAEDLPLVSEQPLQDELEEEMPQAGGCCAEGAPGCNQAEETRQEQEGNEEKKKQRRKGKRKSSKRKKNRKSASRGNKSQNSGNGSNQNSSRKEAGASAKGKKQSGR